MRLGPPPEVPEIPGQFWIDFIRDTAPVFRKPTIEQLGEFIAPTWQALCDGARYVEPRLREIFDELRPDAIVEDNVVGFAAVVTAGRPWARIVSCNPAEVKDPAIPPFSSGYPTTDRSGWPAFLEEVAPNAWRAVVGLRCVHARVRRPGLANGALGPEFIHESPFLNMVLYPEEADYRRATPLGPTWHRLGSCVRATDRDVAAAGARCAGRRRPGRRADLPLARLAGLGRCRPDAAAGRHPRPDPPPGDRQQGPARRPAGRCPTTWPARRSCRSPRSFPRSTW